MRAIRDRRSIRKYKPDSISRSDIAKIIQSGMAALLYAAAHLAEAYKLPKALVLM